MIVKREAKECIVRRTGCRSDKMVNRCCLKYEEKGVRREMLVLAAAAVDGI